MTGSHDNERKYKLQPLEGAENKLNRSNNKVEHDRRRICTIIYLHFSFLIIIYSPLYFLMIVFHLDMVNFLDESCISTACPHQDQRMISFKGIVGPMLFHTNSHCRPCPFRIAQIFLCVLPLSPQASRPANAQALICKVALLLQAGRGLYPWGRSQGSSLCWG